MPAERYVSAISLSPIRRQRGQVAALPVAPVITVLLREEELDGFHILALQFFRQAAVGVVAEVIGRETDGRILRMPRRPKWNRGATSAARCSGGSGVAHVISPISKGRGRAGHQRLAAGSPITRFVAPSHLILRPDSQDMFIKWPTALA